MKCQGNRDDITQRAVSYIRHISCFGSLYDNFAVPQNAVGRRKGGHPCRPLGVDGRFTLVLGAGAGVGRSLVLVLPTLDIRPLAVTFVASRADAILMRPPLLHSSYAAKAPSGRRVVHLEFGEDESPTGVKWRDRV